MRLIPEEEVLVLGDMDACQTPEDENFPIFLHT